MVPRANSTCRSCAVLTNWQRHAGCAEWIGRARCSEGDGSAGAKEMAAPGKHFSPKSVSRKITGSRSCIRRPVSPGENVRAHQQGCGDGKCGRSEILKRHGLAFLGKRKTSKTRGSHETSSRSRRPMLIATPAHAHQELAGSIHAPKRRACRPPCH